MFIQHKIIGVDQLSAGGVIKLKLVACVVASDADATERGGVKCKTVSCCVSGAADVSHTEEWEEVAEVRFIAIDEFERGC